MMTHDLRIAPRHSTALKYTKTVLHGMFLYRGKYFIYLNFPTKDFTGSFIKVVGLLRKHAYHRMKTTSEEGGIFKVNKYPWDF